ncbi:glutamate racemase [Pelotomaculum propionicicum]|uniref:Glutamate racemase n=1 Tax=Pelotomaculum propionicicum TaxID=258475 RepID=A0A4Y7RNP7_9FIRM|nr:glutamate racemase [Pelotomaculum propionicicum]NLI12776.1 glutamate racemase [Peptococcaceae bacterium]TEB10595.1 Glutamate racemase [Pelotomaculum propionicicum]
MSSLKPIGFFDSGVGGLSVMKEVRRLLPAENLLYFADSAYCPYGEKPLEVIRDRVFSICDFLVDKGAKILVLACNTASVAVLDDVRKRFSIQVVGTEPAVKPAAAATKNGRVGVLATQVTLAGDRFNSLVERFGEGVEVCAQACHGLVDMVESGCWEGPEAEALLRSYLDPLLARGVDTIILGCTHYPFLRPVVERIAGSGVSVIDSGEAIARQVARVLERNSLLSGGTAPGGESFFTSGDPGYVEPVMRLLWGDPELVVRQEKFDCNRRCEE